VILEQPDHKVQLVSLELRVKLVHKDSREIKEILVKLEL
jgi:hypothetical protein